MPPEAGRPRYTLVGPDGQPYRSDRPGRLGGHRRLHIYGRLDCPSARRALAAGGYRAHRVFFPDEITAIVAGYRPCGVCLPRQHRAWRTAEDGPPGALPSFVIAGLEEAGYAGELPEPVPCTEAELRAALELAADGPPRARSVAVGHSRDGVSVAKARSFLAAWTAAGGEVAAVVDWPQHAASWLRQARRFASASPDVWVVSAAPLGWAQMARRLRHSTDWAPERTIGLAPLGDPVSVALAGRGTVAGMRSVAPDGSVNRVSGDL